MIIVLSIVGAIVLIALVRFAFTYVIYRELVRSGATQEEIRDTLRSLP